MAASKPTFNRDYWEKAIAKPDWYFDYLKFTKQSKQSLGEESEAWKDLKGKLRDFFERALLDNKVTLAARGPDLDKQRETVDTIVIHHTSDKPGYTLSRMNTVHLLNIYAPYFANPTIEVEEGLKGQAIWSDHLQAGKPVFYAYHWLMRMDGSFERLLKDQQIGWHAGNWDVNKRSIAICLDNDYEQQDPTDEILQKLAKFIINNYPGVEPQNIIGHCEARKDTICPGTNFLDTWKHKLIKYI